MSVHVPGVGTELRVGLKIPVHVISLRSTLLTQEAGCRVVYSMTV
jgi:hypothetical protein